MNIKLQRLLPQHLISRIMGKLAAAQELSYLKNWAIKRFVAHYGVNMAEALQEDYAQYASFNAFFTRHLKPELRPICELLGAVVSPVDGTISRIGDIQQQAILQAKNHYYTLSQLLVEQRLADFFNNGSFITLYLAPKDYHRIHMPVAGQLEEMIYVPGKLFSVNPYTVDKKEGLFARNERVIMLFKTELGCMAVVAVGALIVGSIAARWHGIVKSSGRKEIARWQYLPQKIYLSKGDELGHFQLGSTVIVLFQKNAVAWDKVLQAGSSVKMGQSIAMISPGSNTKELEFCASSGCR